MAIIISLNIWVILVFLLFSVPGTLVEAKQKKAMSLSLRISGDGRITQNCSTILATERKSG